MSTSHSTHADVEGWDPSSSWTLHPMVAVRLERFGALVYHYGTRRLSFLKDPRLAKVVQNLTDGTSVDEVLDAADLSASDRSAFNQALQALSSSQMIVKT